MRGSHRFFRELPFLALTAAVFSIWKPVFFKHFVLILEKIAIMLQPSCHILSSSFPFFSFFLVFSHQLFSLQLLRRSDAVVWLSKVFNDLLFFPLTLRPNFRFCFSALTFSLASPFPGR
jgi:hypothetical protein